MQEISLQCFICFKGENKQFGLILRFMYIWFLLALLELSLATHQTSFSCVVFETVPRPSPEIGFITPFKQKTGYVKLKLAYFILLWHVSAEKVGQMEVVRRKFWFSWTQVSIFNKKFREFVKTSKMTHI